MENQTLKYPQLAQARKEIRAKAIKLLGGKCVVCEWALVPENLRVRHTIVVPKDQRAPEWAKLMLIISNFEGARSNYELLCPNCYQGMKFYPQAGTWNEIATYILYKSWKKQNIGAT